MVWGNAATPRAGKTGGNKRARPDAQQSSAPPPVAAKKQRNAKAAVDASEEHAPPLLPKKKKKKNKKAKMVPYAHHEPEAAATTPIPHDDTPSTPHPSSAHGSVLAKMQQRLAGSHFRWLNEQLYTASSDQSWRLMQGQQELFTQYHEVWGGGWLTQASSTATRAFAVLTTTTTTLYFFDAAFHSL